MIQTLRMPSAVTRRSHFSPNPRWLPPTSSATKGCFSSVTPEDAEATAAAAKLKVEPIRPRPIFPWRHETRENPLPRLDAETEEARYNVPLLPYRGQAFVANMFLGMGFLRTTFTDWPGDLAESAAYAFARGVAGIISNVYRLPMDEVGPEDNVKFRFESKLDDDEETVHDKPTEGSKKKDYCETIDSMLDRPLRKLYESAHESGQSQLQILLEMEPRRALLYNVFCFPFISRSAVEADRRLMDRVMDITSAMRTDTRMAFNQLYDLIYEQLEASNRLTTTVEMQILVECDEIFQVMDMVTGKVLQGSADGQKREVLHLVRFETTATTVFSDSFPYLPDTTHDNWIITDIDDLLGPKKWYHKD